MFIKVSGQTCRMCPNVYRELTLAGESHRTSFTAQRLFRNMRPSMCRHIAFHRKRLVADIARVGFDAWFVTE